MLNMEPLYFNNIGSIAICLPSLVSLAMSARAECAQVGMVGRQAGRASNHFIQDESNDLIGLFTALWLSQMTVFFFFLSKHLLINCYRYVKRLSRKVTKIAYSVSKGAGI